MTRPFVQVDVFVAEPYLGNPVAVVLDGDGLSTEQMQRFAQWTNLSETTFVLPPTTPDADYRVRIFTPAEELPFAGHPTLGTCHAWLEHTGADPSGEVRQECGAGLVPIRRTDAGLALAAPPLLRSGPLSDAELTDVAAILRVHRSEIVDARWADNGPGWAGVLLADAERVLALRPGDMGGYKIGVAGPYPDGAECAIEVRAFFDDGGGMTEDPVTGSLNASIAQWLLGTGRLAAPYVAAQGTAIGRRGRVHVTTADDQIWVAGGTVTCIRGEVAL